MRPHLAASAAFIVTLGVGLFACGNPELGPEFTEPMTLGGQTLSPQVLNAGRDSYIHYCYACHGAKGDGRGPAAKGLRPPPRDFTKAIFKFAGVAAGEFPSDEDLQRIVHHGLNGTAMLAWDVSEEELRNIVQYIKTFGQRRVGTKIVNPWTKARPRPHFVPPADPYGTARRGEAADRGKRLYHTTMQCYLCHPAYATTAELRDFGLTSIRPDPYNAEARDSPDYASRLLPPDFARTPLRSIRVGRQYNDPRSMTDAQIDAREGEDLFRIIASGVPGTAMPSWAAMTPEDLWAIVYFVRSLVDIRGTPAAEEMRERLLHETPLPPPTETPEGAAPPPAATPAPATH